MSKMVVFCISRVAIMDVFDRLITIIKQHKNCERNVMAFYNTNKTTK